MAKAVQLMGLARLAAPIRLLKKAFCLFQNTRTKNCDFCFSHKINDLQSSILPKRPCSDSSPLKFFEFQQPARGPLACVVASALGFAGCVTVPVDQSDDVRLSTLERHEEQLGTPPGAEPPSRSTLVDSLQRSARERAAVGQWEQAEALVLRALRIEPQAPDLYLQLAELRTRQGNTADAEAIARKGLTYSESGSRVAQDLHQYLQAGALSTQELSQ